MSMQFTAIKRVRTDQSGAALHVFGDALVESFYPDGWTPEAEGIPNPRYRADLDISLSNSNAADIASALGWPLVDSYIEIPIDRAIVNCTTYLRQHIGRPSPATVPYVLIDAPRLIVCARAEGYLERTIHRIVLMLQEGRSKGATHLVAA